MEEGRGNLKRVGKFLRSFKIQEVRQEHHMFREGDEQI